MASSTAATSRMVSIDGSNRGFSASLRVHSIEAHFQGTRGGAAFRNVNGSFYDFCAEHLQGTRRTVLEEPPDTWGGSGPPMGCRPRR